MPLITSIERDGERLKLPNGWGGFHVVSIVFASHFDVGSSPFTNGWQPPESYPETPMEIGNGFSHVMDYGVIALSPLNAGRVTLTKTHRFRDENDGEILELLPGDVLIAYRN